MRPLTPRALLIVALLASAILPATTARASTGFTDVPSTYWDYTAITYVGQTNLWMQDYGSMTFQPTTKETRSLLASALVKAYAPSEPIDPSIVFDDLPTTDPFYRYANVAVKLGWIEKFSGNRWGGGSAVPKSLFDRAITLALKLSTTLNGLANIKQADGDKYTVGDRWPHLQVAAILRLHFNHSDESLDLGSSTTMKRDEVAYSLWKAKTNPSYMITNLSRFNSVVLPALNETITAQAQLKAMTQFALNQVGFPYIYGGEWNAASPTGYCCGTQPQGGFDCSGFVWFVMKKYEDGYNAAQFHTGYPGWSLHERSSSQMAQYTTTPITFDKLQIGDLMFQASNGGSTYKDVDHVSLFLGNGWMIHSTDGGPQLEYTATGWYKDYFVYGRRIVGTAKSGAASVDGSAPADWLLEGDPPVGPVGP
jgi:cell wall-associated NlpC family hydrolase